MHALVVLNGASALYPSIIRRRTEFDLVLVTDGAANNIPADFAPSIICGDFDSIDAKAAEQLHPRAEIVRLADQEQSDLEKAVELARARGATRVTLTAGFGGRIDHTLCTFAILRRYHRELPMTLFDQNTEVRVISPESFGGPTLELQTRIDQIISLISLSDHANVSICGVAWPLLRSDLRAGTRGVSNRALANAVTITAHAGVIAVCHLIEDM